jgi:hypothetical protein
MAPSSATRARSKVSPRWVFGPDNRYYVGLRRRAQSWRLSHHLTQLASISSQRLLCRFPAGLRSVTTEDLILASGTRPNGMGDNALVAFDPSERKQSIRLVSDSELSPSIFRSLPTATSSCRASTHSDHQMPSRLFANTIPRTDISCASFSANRPAKISQTVWPAVWSDDKLYCVAQDEVVAFDFISGECFGSTVQFPRLYGQAIEFFP